MKIPIIKKGEYDIWSMRMHQYIYHIDHNLWDIIVNRDLQEEPAPIGDQSAIPDEYLLKFHNVPDAKSLWEAIKSRFGGNEESKKMQEDINQKFLRSFPPSWNQIALIMRNKPDIDEIDIDDLYNNFRVYEDEMKRSSSSTSTSQNLAFLSSENTSNTNEVSTASRDFGVSTAGGISQIDEDDLEELDLRQQVAMLTIWKESREKTYGDNGESNAPINESSSQALVAQDGLGGYDWSNDFEVEPVNYALMAISSSSSLSSSDNEISLSVFDVRSSDEESTPANDRFSKADGYHVVPPPITGNFLTLRADISFAGLDEYAIRKKIIESKTTDLNTKTSETVGKTNEANTQKPKTVYESVNRDKVIIEDWNSDDEDDVSEVQTVSPVKTNETQTVKTRVDKIGQTSQKQGIGFKKIKACFVCKSTDHLIKDCNFHDKQSQEPKLKTVVNTGPRVGKLVWDNTKRVNHQKFSKYPHLRKTFVPSGVLTRTGLITPVKQNEKRAVHKVSNVRLVVLIGQLVLLGLPKGSYSPIKRSYYTKPAFRPKDLKQDVKTFGVQNMTTARTRAVVSTGKGKMDIDLRKSRWVWRPKGNYLDHVSNDSGSLMLKKGNLDILLQDHVVVDSGCSSHITGNKAYLSDYEDFNGGFVAFGKDEQVLHDELEKMIAQEVVAKALDDATRQAFEEQKRNIASQKRAA
ncbi:hypothetical protein Tco_0294896 [Tanacetum coccineum]